jgi:hypothetical protein
MRAKLLFLASGVCITNGSGGYNSRLADTKEPEAPTTPSHATPMILPMVLAEFIFPI